MKAVVLVIAIALALTGCASKHPAAKSVPVVSASAIYRPEVGADAALMASHISGCADVLSISTGADGPKGGLASTATCTMVGHTVIIDSFTSADATSDFPALLKDAVAPVVYGDGGSWAAFLAEDGATAAQTTLQMQLMNDVSGLLAQSLATSASHPPALDVQETVAKSIVQALGGTVQRAG